MPDDARQSELRSCLLALKQVVDDLTDANRELTLVLIEERRAKVTQWGAADPNASEKAKERLADFHALDHSLDILKLKGEITLLTERQDYLLTLLSLLRTDLWQSAVGL